jgi:hypothetical protein
LRLVVEGDVPSHVAVFAPVGARSLVALSVAVGLRPVGGDVTIEVGEQEA